MTDERAFAPDAPAAGLRDPEGQFARNYNIASFSFAHELSRHPLFDLQHLVECSRNAADPALTYLSNGQVGVGDRWETSLGPRYTVQETIANIAHNNSLVMLKRIELQPAFAPLMRDVMERLMDLAGPKMRSDVIVGRGTLLIASPHRITSYHIDADTNFLFQITGDKSISVFDQTDRTLLSEQELERYYAGDGNGAVFKQSHQQNALTYDLKAGLGIHIPSMAPHWAQNGAHPSVALSVNFDLHSIARLGRIYKMNHRLRRYGITPTPPGGSVWRDRLKLASLKGLAATQGLLRK
jgi:hypothetical protein